MSTPIYDELKTEMPEVEIPSPVPLTYEECVEHATAPRIEPTEENSDSQEGTEAPPAG